MQKNSNEITVEVLVSLDELIKILNKNNFQKIKDYNINDIYFVKNGVDITTGSFNIFNDTILLRNLIYSDHTIKYITYKKKKYDELGNILEQSDNSCEIMNIGDAKKLLLSLEYKELLTLNDHLLIYKNDDLEFAVQVVNDKFIFIEIEENDNDGIDELKNKFDKLCIPIKNNNYFAKKALNVLKENLSNCN